MAFIKKIQLPNGEIYDIYDEDAARQIDIDTAIEQHDTSTEAHQDIREIIDNIQSDIKSQSIYEKDVLESDWILNEETQRYDLTIAQSEHNCGLDAYVVEVASITDTTRESIIFNSNVAIQTGEITVSVSTPSACRIVIMGNIQILTTGKANMYSKDVVEADWSEIEDGIYQLYIPFVEHNCGQNAFVLDVAKTTGEGFSSVMKDSIVDSYGNITIQLTAAMEGKILICGTLVDFQDFNALQTLPSIASNDCFFVKSQANGIGQVAFNTIIPNNAAAHNAIYRGKNIQDKFESGSLYSAIQDGTFEDLFIGDYFDININTSLGGSETVRCMLAGFDVYWGCGDTALFTHHAVIVPANCFATSAPMNEERTNTGGYIGSAMYTTVLPVYQAALESVFGDNLITNRELLTNAVASGSSSGQAWFDCKIRLMNEAEVYGGNVWSGSFDVGIAKGRLPLFTLNPAKIVCSLGGINYASNQTRNSWWLSDVVSVEYFAYVQSRGNANRTVASDSCGVRPRFLIG